MESTLKRTWAEVDLDALAHNYERIRRHVGEKTKLLGVIKADAYGHGAVPVAKELEALGASYLAVSNIDECEEVRRGGVTLPVLMLGFTPADQAERILELDMTQAVQSLDIAKAFSAAAVKCGKKMKVHIKLDTGMGRLGFLCDEEHFDESLQDILAALELPGLDVEGVFTHFCVADEEGEENVAFTRTQHERFLRMIDAAEARSGFHFRLRHCCNAGGIVCYPEWAGDMVRCGIILYGSGELAERMGMEPVMSLKTRVATVRDLAPGTSVSYGRTYFTERESRIAVLPIGYADGLHRTLSNRMEVLTPYGRAKQVGRICMDMCMIDVTDLPEVKSGDEVEIFGKNVLCAEDAAACGTIPYELLCAVSKRVPRHYFLHGKRVDTDLTPL
ncbi:MAG: alanine racemase [Oscillospiraceae bacterium]